MPAVNTSTIRRIVYAGASCRRLYRGATLIWEPPPFGRQVMNSAVTQTPPTGSTPAKITGFTSYSSYPAIVNNNDLVVAGSGSATVAVALNRASSIFTTEATLRLNGVVIWTKTGQADITGSVSVNVVDGDRLSLWHRSTSGLATATAGATVDLTPV